MRHSRRHSNSERGISFCVPEHPLTLKPHSKLHPSSPNGPREGDQAEPAERLAQKWAAYLFAVEQAAGSRKVRPPNARRGGRLTARKGTGHRAATHAPEPKAGEAGESKLTHRPGQVWHLVYGQPDHSQGGLCLITKGCKSGIAGQTLLKGCPIQNWRRTHPHLHSGSHCSGALASNITLASITLALWHPM